MKTLLIDRFRSRSATIGIVGLGYVGLPLSLNALRQGFTVIGFDTDEGKVGSLLRGESYLKHLSTSDLGSYVASGAFTPTSDYSLVSNVDAVIICVPTPLGRHREPDLSFIQNTMTEVAKHLRPGTLVSLESSTYPGTTEEYIAGPIEAAGLKVGQELFVAYSPEREDPGNPTYNTKTIPKVVGGITAGCRDVAQAMYETIVDSVVMVGSARVAEMTKLLENTYRAVNIGLVNELKMVADTMGIDIWEVIHAASTKPFGYTPFYPGPGLGGHCIPIDPFYLTWKAKEHGINTRFIELAGEINSAMPQWVVRKTVDALNSRGIAISRAKVVILGISYKQNIDDMRESPSVEIASELLGYGADVSYSDPYVPVLPPMRKYDLDMRSVDLTAEMIGSCDCVIVATDHDAFDYDMIAKHAQLIVDTRGKYRYGTKNVVPA